MGVTGDVLSPHPKAREHGQPSGLQGQLGGPQRPMGSGCTPVLGPSCLSLQFRSGTRAGPASCRELLCVSMGSVEFGVWQPQMRGGV